MADKESDREHRVSQGIYDGLVQIGNRQLAAFHRARREIKQTGDSTECGTYLAELDVLAELPHRKVKDNGELRQRRTAAVSGLTQILGNDQDKILEVYRDWRAQALKREQQPPASQI